MVYAVLKREVFETLGGSLHTQDPVDPTAMYQLVF